MSYEKLESIANLFTFIILIGIVSLILYFVFFIMRDEKSKINYYDIFINDIHYTDKRTHADKTQEIIDEISENFKSTTKLDPIDFSRNKIEEKSIHLYLKDGYEYIPNYKYKSGMAIDRIYDTRTVIDYSNEQLNQQLYGSSMPTLKYVDEYFIKYKYYDINGNLVKTKNIEVSYPSYRDFKQDELFYDTADVIKYKNSYYELN